MTLADKIRAGLLIGPSTASEMAMIGAWRVKLISSYFASLLKSGDVSEFGRITGGSGKPSVIFQLTERGKRRAIHSARIVKTVHTTPVSCIDSTEEARPIPMISGAKTINKTLKRVTAAPHAGRFAAFEAPTEETLPSLGETVLS